MRSTATAGTPVAITVPIWKVNFFTAGLFFVARQTVASEIGRGELQGSWNILFNSRVPVHP
jgi:hypothetical protein